MGKISRKAYAKINLGLDVLRKRKDGYHEVKMIMQTVGIYDVLTFEKSSSGIELLIDEKTLPADRHNLVYKAAELLMDTYSIEGGVKITLQKQIPIAAGMAGGSTDAAAVFHGLNELFELKLSIEEMCRLGVKIGADVPFCIQGGTCLSEGIGELLTELPMPPKAFVLIAKPEINVSTKFVYENLHADQLKEHPDIDGMALAIREGKLAGITERMGNVLETVTIKEYPVIDEIKTLMKQEAENALMSGSGPTVFGIYTDQKKAERAMEQIKKQGLAKQVFVTDFVNNKER